MSKELASYERALSVWRNKEAQAEALRQFRDAGGQHRIRITTDNDNAVIENLISAMMDGKGYVAILNSAIGRAENDAAVARRDFMSAADTERLTTDKFGNVKREARS